MNMSIKGLVGVTEFTITGEVEGLKHIFEVGSLVAGFPKECGKCGDGNLSFSHRNVEDNDYYSIVCNSCRAELKYGQLKNDKSGLFKKSWEDHYQKQATTNGTKTTTPYTNASISSRKNDSFTSEPLNDSDIPF